jgi:hypothetical protein
MKDLRGYEGIYAVTKDGRIWSHPHTQTLKGNGGAVYTRKYKGKWLRPYKAGAGYLMVALCLPGILPYKKMYVHRLVAAAFCDLLAHEEVNHRDGNKDNNTATNLQVCTRSENVQHSYDTGLRIAPYDSRRERGEDGRFI